MRAIQVLSSSSCAKTVYLHLHFRFDLMMEDHEDDGGQRSRVINPSASSRLSSSHSLTPSPQPPGSPFLSRSSQSYAEDTESEDDSESYSGSETDESDEEFSASTLEASTAAKQSIERFYKNFFRSLKERQDRYVNVISNLLVLVLKNWIFDSVDSVGSFGRPQDCKGPLFSLLLLASPLLLL